MSDEKPMKHVVVGVWTILRPDTRQYKQQSVEITLDQPIAVEVPEELVYKTVTDPKTGDITDILTPAGMAYVQQQFEKLYLVPEDKEGGWEAPVTKKVAGLPAPAETKSDDGWEDATDDLPAKSDSKDEDWGEDVFESSEPSNKPDTETDAKWEDDWA